ncbi:MAG: flavin reductase family protein [Pseudomonadota bacterium]
MTEYPFTSRQLRDGFSRFATGVTIVTASGAHGEPVGMTASSFNTVSLEPPLILWCPSKSALSGPAFRDAPYFAVHVLAADQGPLSSRFATKGTDKFEGLENWRQDEHGVPHLQDCMVRFDCRQWAAHEGGDHWIVVGEVMAIAEGAKGMGGEGLVFRQGRYAHAVDLDG